MNPFSLLTVTGLLMLEAFTIHPPDFSGAAGNMGIITTSRLNDPVQIELLLVVPESAPGEADGAIHILVTIPGTEPYQVLLNDIPWGAPVSGTEIPVTGLTAGPYTVRLVDFEGLMSNTLDVIVLGNVANDPADIYLGTVLAETASGEMDGSMSIHFASSPDHPPYEIFLNDISIGTTNGDFVIGNLSAGAYTVYITDVDGVQSNTLMVTIPLLVPELRVNNIRIEPIIYEAGPQHEPGTHAWITFDMQPGATLEYFNLGIIIPANSVYWVIRNLPIPPLTDVQTVSYRINIEELDPLAPIYSCEYHVGPEWYATPSFPASITVDVAPVTASYHVLSGSHDPLPPFEPFIIPPVIFPPDLPGEIELVFRGCDVPNIDLDYSTQIPPGSTVPSDSNACGPAAAANSLHWLVQQHPELSGDTTTLREKTDALKQYMNLALHDTNGVRFDSMVVGKLTLIDALQLPIRVKYQTKHLSGNTGVPLASLDDTYGHVADNQGSLGVHPNFDWYKQEIDDGEDVEVHVGWYDPPDANGMRKRKGGHWLVATGYFDADSAQGIWLKDDSRQSVTNPDALRNEFYEWDTLPGGIPYLRGLVDNMGRIAIVESLVSESYDPNITFVDMSQFDWTYKPVIYLSGDNLESYDFHAWLEFEHPVVPEYAFLNVRMRNPANSMEDWVVQNLPITPNATPRPIHYRMDVRGISQLTGPPDNVVAEISMGSYHITADFPYQSAFLLQAQPTEHYVPDGHAAFNHASLPRIPLVDIFPEEPDTVYGLSRECVVPNIDLDSIKHPNPVTGDKAACGPAAAANSLRWLMEHHPELPEVDSLRAIMDSLKILMNKDSAGVLWEDMVKGKLAFIDRHQLPIRVKYQVHTPYPGFRPIIKSPDTTYGHAAENKTGPTGIPDFEWLCNELQEDEDVEIGITYWCPDSNGVMRLVSGHYVNVTGYEVVGDERWLIWKHDPLQNKPGGPIEEKGRWVKDTSGYPVLKEISQTPEGCIAYVGDVISESYDPTVVFNNISAYDWMYKPIVYLGGSVQDDPYQAWLVFTLPIDTNARFLNVKMCNPATGAMHWILKNVPLMDRSSPMPVRIKMDLRPLVTGDTIPTNLIMKYHIGSYQVTEDFPIQSYAELDAWPALYFVPNGGNIGPHPLIPRLPPIPLTPLPPYVIEHIIRGCEVPNIDLDTTMYPLDSMDLETTDLYACGPAAAANSLQWLDDQHEEIDIPIELRPMLDSLKRMMKLNSLAEGGVDWMDLVKGKLEFIDKYQLPIKVKYQAHANAPPEIPSPNPVYGHKATNESDLNPDPDAPFPYLHPSFDWLCQELMDDEDVEMLVGFYCDTLVEVIDTITMDTLMDGTIIADTLYTIETKLDRKSGHVVNVTGKVSIGPLKWITYKHDTNQDGPGGTSPEDAPEGYAYTDISEWIPAVGGYSIIQRESYIEEDGDVCTAYVDAVVTESYDPEILFCPVKVCIPDDNGHGTLRDALACAAPDATITLGEEIANDTIFLTSGPLVINQNVRITRGDGAFDPTPDIWSIKGESVSRVFEIQPGVTLTLEGIHIICGEASSGSCVLNHGTAIFRDIQFFNHNGLPGNSTQIMNNGNGIIIIEGNTNLKID